MSITRSVKTNVFQDMLSAKEIRVTNASRKKTVANSITNTPVKEQRITHSTITTGPQVKVKLSTVMTGAVMKLKSDVRTSASQMVPSHSDMDTTTTTHTMMTTTTQSKVNSLKSVAKVRIAVMIKMILTFPISHKEVKNHSAARLTRS